MTRSDLVEELAARFSQLNNRKNATAFFFFLRTQPISPIEYDAIAKLDGS